MTPINFPRARGLVWVFTAALAFVFSGVSGCGDSATTEGQVAPDASQQQAQKNMEDFMKTQSKKKK